VFPGVTELLIGVSMSI